MSRYKARVRFVVEVDKAGPWEGDKLKIEEASEQAIREAKGALNNALQHVEKPHSARGISVLSFDGITIYPEKDR